MNKLLACWLPVALLATPGHAALYTASVSGSPLTVPDNDPRGVTSSVSLSGLPTTLSTVAVTLNLSGGFNGDLYAYLYHDGQAAVLLNRVGLTEGDDFGYADSGFGPDRSGHAFTLADAGAADVHYYQDVPYTLGSGGWLTGTWQPDGRGIDPGSPGAAFDVADRNQMLSVFSGADPNGTWSLFVADLSPGNTSTLNGWSVQVTTVPEATTALAGLAALALVGVFRPRRRDQWSLCRNTHRPHQ